MKSQCLQGVQTLFLAPFSVRTPPFAFQSKNYLNQKFSLLFATRNQVFRLKPASSSQCELWGKSSSNGGERLHLALKMALFQEKPDAKVGSKCPDWCGQKGLDFVAT